MTPKPRLCVTYATAGISNSGSLTGTCTTFAIAASGDPRYSDAVYKRHGTTTLFAALSLFDGTVIGRCMQRHRHLKFIRFLNAVERQVAAGKPIHVVLDNYATHKHPKVLAWLAAPMPVQIV